MPWLVSQASISLGLIRLKWGSGQPDSIIAGVVVQTASKTEIARGWSGPEGLSSDSEL